MDEFKELSDFLGTKIEKLKSIKMENNLIPDEVNTYDEMLEYLLTIAPLPQNVKDAINETYIGKVATLARIMKQKDDHIKYLTDRVYKIGAEGEKV